MNPFPKPRGFWDYTLFASMMTGLLVFLFSSEARDRVGWADAALASGVALLIVLFTILARRGEKARWIARPTWQDYLLITLASYVLMVGAVYADTYLLHRRDVTSNRLRYDTVTFIVDLAGALWSVRGIPRPKRKLP